MTLILRQPNRRSLFFALPQVALSAACAIVAVRTSSPAPSDRPPAVVATHDSHPPEPVTSRGPEATPRRALPLPTPIESEQLWLDQWLNFVSMTNRKVISGC
ncbi:MAG TPA: hypothetical protein VFN74_08570 [Chloroflexota bacterium]|nr:hypothetical protein [Chloroflexota bacterium]